MHNQCSELSHSVNTTFAPKHLINAQFTSLICSATPKHTKTHIYLCVSLPCGQLNLLLLCHPFNNIMQREVCLQVVSCTLWAILATRGG